MNYFKKLIFILKEIGQQNTLIISILIFLQSLFETFGIGTLYPIMSMMTNYEIFLDSKIYLFISKNIFDLTSKSEFQVKLIFILAALSFFTIKLIFSILVKIYFNVYIMQSKVLTSRYLLRHYFEKDFKYHLDTNSSKIIQNVNDNASQLQSAVGNLIYFFSDLFLIFLITSIFMIYNLMYTVLILFFSFLFLIILIKLTKKKVKYWSQKREFFIQNSIKHLYEMFTLVKEIYISGKFNFFMKKYSHNDYLAFRMDNWGSLIQILPRLFIEFIVLSCFLLLLFFFMIYDTSLIDHIPLMTILVAAIVKTMPLLVRIMGCINFFNFTSQPIDSIYNVFNSKKNSYVDGNSSQKSIDFKKISIFNFNYKYKKDDASFVFKKDINFDIYSNDIIGVVGSSGSGKSTLINNISSLLSDFKGDIMVDDIPLKEFYYRWRSNISYVSQKIFLVDDTIKENILFSSSIDENRLSDVIKICELNSFINNLDNGVNTFVGENGKNISGGQAQRIGIARALYQNKKILILDEALSNIDKDTKIKIIKNLKNISTICTVIMITHFREDLEICDKILDLDNL